MHSDYKSIISFIKLCSWIFGSDRSLGKVSKKKKKKSMEFSITGGGVYPIPYFFYFSFLKLW